MTTEQLLKRRNQRSIRENKKLRIRIVELETELKYVRNQLISAEAAAKLLLAASTESLASKS